MALRRVGRGLVAKLSLLDAMCTPDEARPPEAIAAVLVGALMPEPDEADDDVCLLVVRRGPVGPPALSQVPRVGAE